MTLTRGKSAESWLPIEEFKKELFQNKNKGWVEDEGWPLWDVSADLNVLWRPIQYGYQFKTELGTILSYFPGGRCMWYEPNNVFAHSNEQSLRPAELLIRISRSDIIQEFRKR